LIWGLPRIHSHNQEIKKSKMIFSDRLPRRGCSFARVFDYHCRMETDYSCGVIPVRIEDGTRYYLLVQHKAGHWSFPKGHPEGSEAPLEAARRELMEETGLMGAKLLEAPAFEETYEFTKRSGKQVIKHVTYYLGRVETDAVEIQPEEIAAYAWGDSAQTHDQMTFAEGRSLLAEVDQFLDERGGKSIGL